MLRVGVVDYGCGNISSIVSAIKKLGHFPVVLNENLSSVDGLILPGVGAFPNAVHNLISLGLDKELVEYANSGKPLLGICLGMQILFESSEEIKYTSGLGLVKGDVIKFSKEVKVPQIQWNKISIKGSSDFYYKHSDNDFFYFLHSYYVKSNDELTGWSVTNYSGYEFLSSFQKGNIFGCQFHPEKSGIEGLNLLNNFFKHIKE